MAVLNVRIDDQVRDQLKSLAEANDMTLSEFTRNLLLEVVQPIIPGGPPRGDAAAPESLKTMDRQVLSLLHRILARVLPEDSNDVDGNPRYQLERARVLEHGFTSEYWMEIAGFNTELSRRDCGRVSDILQMFRVIWFSIDQLQTDGKPLDAELADRLVFKGFDFNDQLEGQMAQYVKYQIGKDLWTELQPQIAATDGGNSHRPMLDTYSRMLAEYRRILDGRERGAGVRDWELSKGDLERLAQALMYRGTQAGLGNWQSREEGARVTNTECSSDT